MDSPVTLDVDIGPLPTTPIAGDNAVAIGTTGSVYSVIAEPGYTYTWSISAGGTIQSGQGTGSVTVDWGLIPGNAIITVNASNACGPAAPVTLACRYF